MIMIMMMVVAMIMMLMAKIIMMMLKLSLDLPSSLFNYIAASLKVSIFKWVVYMWGSINSCLWNTFFSCTFTLHAILLHLVLLTSFFLETFSCGFQNHLFRCLLLFYFISPLAFALWFLPEQTFPISTLKFLYFLTSSYIFWSHIICSPEATSCTHGLNNMYTENSKFSYPVQSPIFQIPLFNCISVASICFPCGNSNSKYFYI